MQHLEPHANTQASGLQLQRTAHPVQVIAVTAGKGGVGKTNVSANLAIALAKQKKRVMLLDADLGLANVDVLLGVHSKNNIGDVLAGECQLTDIIVEGPGGIKIIPSSSGTQALTQLSSLEHSGIISAFGELSQHLDVLVIDTAAGISDSVVSFTRSAQEVVVVVCDEPTSITDAYALIKVMSRDHNVNRFHVLANMVNTAKEGRDLFVKLNRVTDQFLNVQLDYLGAISFDEYLRKAVKQQKPVITAYPSSQCSREIKKIAEKVAEWPVNFTDNGNTRFFLEQLITMN